MTNLDPKRMAAVQRVSGQVTATITVDHAAKTVLLAFETANPEANKFIEDALLEQIPTMFAQQLSVMFKIKGELIDVNRPGS